VKITFQGETIHDILTQMENTVAVFGIRKSILSQVAPSDETKNVAPAPAQGPGPDVFADMGLAPTPPVETPVAKSVDKPGKTRTPTQLENDEKLRERALAKKAAGLKPFDKMPKSAPAVEKVVPPPASAESLGLAPDEVVKLRQKTIADLQDAYANGHQKEVFELLSRFGNGAKSFRELPPDAFVPISEAIANGALT
jgi:hypothetical protein